MKYRKGFKYQLAEEYQTQTSMFPEVEIREPFLLLETSGRLTIRAGYAWDGPSGPTIDTSSFMRGALVHDALYQILRAKGFDNSAVWRKVADKELRRICVEDGMWRIRACYVWWCVRLMAGGAASPASRKRIYRAG